MCGIAGYWNPRSNHGSVESQAIALRMADALLHRGPDGGGAWADASAGLALGHRRLAVLDLSSEGQQPMHSADGRYVVVFNGEIYNFAILRVELGKAGYAFRGHSDTEVMLAAFCEWGIEPSLKRFVGMFAFALWDREERVLYLARDRAGEKPLYYGWTGGAFTFGSELKALRAYPGWCSEVNRGALALLLRYGYIEAPHCVYENVSKLLPGCLLTASQEQIAARATPQPQPYWSLSNVAEVGVSHPFSGTKAAAEERLLHLLRQAVDRQMVADVPVGAFLSGGIDSSTVVALMQAQSGRPIKTFSIGFDEEDFNEAPFAKAVARHLGTDHTEYYVQPKELQRVIPRLPEIYDEPFADNSQIPTVLLCELARQQVTVSLSGDAGDELFGGYSRYEKAQSIWRCLNQIPLHLRTEFANQLKRLCQLAIEAAIQPGRGTHFLNRLANLSDLLPAAGDQSLYQLLMSPCRAPETWLKHSIEPPTQFTNPALWQQLPGMLQRMMHLDFQSYLPDDILVKVDRAAMSVSLETRIPLLDHPLIEFAWTLPGSLLQRRSQGKWLLRQILYRYVPAILVKRPKRGFAVPIANWVRGPLRAWAEELLGETRLSQEGFFEPSTVRRNWSEHLSGKRDWGQPLWHVLTFQAWLQRQKVTASAGGPDPAQFRRSDISAAPLRAACL